MVKKIYVGNIPWSTQKEEIEELFGQYGEVTSVNIITDRETGRSRGFCFVEMENADEAITALNEKEMNGRNLRVSEANARKPRDFR